MSFGFKSQLRAGQIGEVLYHAAHPHYTRTDGMTCDFYTDTGSSIELKSDMYSVDATPNYFMERWSNVESQKPGGPWQSLQKGVEFFAYLYVPSLVIYTFPVDALVARLETIIPDMKPFPVANKSYTTHGYRVSRDLVMDLATVSYLKVTVSST